MKRADKVITGQDIDTIHTLKSMYDNDSVRVWVGKKHYYMKVSEIYKFDTDFCALKFKVVKKRVREYLEVIQESD